MLNAFVRTVLGDVPADEIGVCYAHEHLIIDRSAATERYPGVLLDSEENCVTELKQFHADGGRTMVDSMPCDAGRNVVKLASVSSRTGVNIVCPTGLHLVQYYPHGKRPTRASRRSGPRRRASNRPSSGRRRRGT
ncbi:MAG: hypothetical protein AAGJ97_13625, partial [Planctomycetota bacterium]